MRVMGHIREYTPKLLIIAAALCFGGAIGFEYHEDQVVANKVLAEKVNPPDAVMIQDFDPERDVNAMDELHILAEIQAGQQIFLNIGDEQIARWICVMPLYPVSREALPLAEHHILDHVDQVRRADAQVYGFGS